MAMSKKRMLELTLARMNTNLNEIIMEEQMSQPAFEALSGGTLEHAQSDHRDLSFDRTRLMLPFLWN